MQSDEGDEMGCDVCGGSTTGAAVASRLAPYSFGVCAHCHEEGLEPAYVIGAALGFSQRMRLRAAATERIWERRVLRVLSALTTRTVEDGAILVGYATRTVREHVEARGDTVARAGIAALVAHDEGLLARDEVREVILDAVVVERGGTGPTGR